MVKASQITEQGRSSVSGARALLVVPVEVSMVPSALKWPRT